MAAAGATPLAQRQWRQQAQRAVRLALTAIKAARSRFAEQSEAGERVLSQLCNSVLTHEMLPSLQLGALSALPDIKQAAGQKLRRQQGTMYQQLLDAVQALRGCVEEMEAAVASLRELPQAESWQLSAPVFHSATLRRTAGLLAGVAAMHSREADSKASVLAAVAAQLLPQGVAGAAAAEVPPHTSDGGSSGVGASAPAAGARKRALKRGEVEELCSVYVSCWMLAPFLEEERAEEVLGALTEDMAGF